MFLLRIKKQIFIHVCLVCTCHCNLHRLLALSNHMKNTQKRDLMCCNNTNLANRHNSSTWNPLARMYLHLDKSRLLLCNRVKNWNSEQKWLTEVLVRTVKIMNKKINTSSVKKHTSNQFNLPDNSRNSRYNLQPYEHRLDSRNRDQADNLAAM